jgi:hypothetical protein
MTRPRLIIGVGIFLGVAGAAAQLWLMQFGALASAPLRALLSMSVAVLIGVIAGTKASADGVKAATLMGVVAGAILTTVGVGALLMDPALLGMNPFASAESFLIFASSLVAGTVVSSWVIAAVAALVAWPVSLSYAAAGER